VPQLSESIQDKSMQDIIALADGPSLINRSCPREGIVFKSYGVKLNELYGKISFKIVSNKYLLKE